jgi:mono/diheme cytochrome c family protein
MWYMIQPWFRMVLVLFAAAGSLGRGAITAEQAKSLPLPAAHAVDFTKEIKPIFEASCIKCHGRGKDKGGLRIDSRETLLKGGESGPVVISGKSAESLLIALVQGLDPDSVMPKKGSRLTPEQVGLLRAWIDQGLPWDASVTFGRLEPTNLKPHRPELPPGPKSANPIDRFIEPYFITHKIKMPPVVGDRLYARRVYLDVIGLLPPTEELEKFVADRRPDKRERLVQRLLTDERKYAEHWLTFWNDLLRNDYRGTGFIDGGRKQITAWLYSALLTNMPYDRFVSELIDPTPASEGFTKGIVWRGVVNASQTPQMQAAQSICQVFMGVNLKCTSCHDSFINDLTLADAYGLAGIYADGPLEMVKCDRPLGKKAELKFIYPELGPIDPGADKPARLKRLAQIITQPQDARLTTTLVNRLWQRFFGRGLVEPVDDMEKTAWNVDLLDWLASDFAQHNYDVQFLIQQILTSRTYQLPAVNLGEQTQQEFVFRGPAVRRLSAEQFRDALTSLTGIGYSAPAAEVTPSPTEQKQFALPVSPSWIWDDAHAAEKTKAGHVYFRKVLELPAVPADATAAVICDNSFTLFVNGHQVGSGNEFKNAYLFDLKPWLKRGQNLFAVDAVNHLTDNTLPTANPPPGSENPAGLLFYARLRHFEKGAHQTNDFVSDASWICTNAKLESWELPEFVPKEWMPAIKLGDIGMLPWRSSKDYIAGKLAAAYPGKVRASLVGADALMTALGRPNREQIVTTRPTAATTLEALEMTNGETLDDILKRGAQNLLAPSGQEATKSNIVKSLFTEAFGREPTRAELQSALDVAGKPVQPAGLEDLLWAITMSPEFQLIY